MNPNGMITGKPLPSEGRYLYGLIRGTEGKDFGCIGLEHGGKPSRVYTLHVDSMAAVISEYSASGNIRPLRKNLEPHHKVIREVMGRTTIIPMPFGHVAESEGEIADTLRRNRDSILAEFDRLDGRIEMGLRVTWDVENIFEFFVGMDCDLAALRDQIFGRSHAPTHAEMIELGRLFEERLAEEREKHTERVIAMFRSCSADVKENPPKGEKVVMDLAFLVDQEGMKAFEDKVHEVAAMFPAQYTFDYNGPWAPFNFVGLDLRATEL